MVVYGPFLQNVDTIALTEQRNVHYAHDHGHEPHPISTDPVTVRDEDGRQCTGIQPEQVLRDTIAEGVFATNTPSVDDDNGQLLNEDVKVVRRQGLEHGCLATPLVWERGSVGARIARIGMNVTGRYC